jgi:hypothetical protein
MKDAAGADEIAGGCCQIELWGRGSCPRTTPRTTSVQSTLSLNAYVAGRTMLPMIGSRNLEMRYERVQGTTHAPLQSVSHLLARRSLAVMQEVGATSGAWAGRRLVAI